MNLSGPVRWKSLGIFALLLGGPTCLITYPVVTCWAALGVAAAFGGRTMWRRLEPIPPALAAPDRPFGLPPPSAARGAMRPVPEPLGPAGVARAFRRSLTLTQTYARTALAFAALAGGSFVAATTLDVNVGMGAASVAFYAAWAFLATALGLGTVGVGLMLRDSLREARDAKLDG